MEPRSIVFQGDGENKRWVRENDQSGKLLHIVNTWCVQVLRFPNLFKKNYSSQEAENAVISHRNHPVDVHIFHNAHATIAWPRNAIIACLTQLLVDFDEFHATQVEESDNDALFFECRRRHFKINK